MGTRQGCTVSKLSGHLRRHGMLRMRLPVSRRPAHGRVHHSVLLRETQTSATFSNQAVEIVPALRRGGSSVTRYLARGLDFGEFASTLKKLPRPHRSCPR